MPAITKGLHMKRHLLFAAVVLLASAAWAAFLDDLATNANKVVSSPYATGGDMILQDRKSVV